MFEFEDWDKLEDVARRYMDLLSREEIIQVFESCVPDNPHEYGDDELLDAIIETMCHNGVATSGESIIDLFMCITRHALGETGEE